MIGKRQEHFINDSEKWLIARIVLTLTMLVAVFLLLPWGVSGFASVEGGNDSMATDGSVREDGT